MTKKRIRQMNAALLRRLSLRPAAEYLAGREETAVQLELFSLVMPGWESGSGCPCAAVMY